MAAVSGTTASSFNANSLRLNGSARLEGTRLRLTDGLTNEAGSAFMLVPANIQAFTNDFTFQATNPLADGFTFVIQNQGPTALGGYGVNLGYGADGSGIQKSIAIKFDFFGSAGEGSNSTGLFTNGKSPTTPSVDLSSTNINLHSGNVFHAHMTYDGNLLTVVITDTATNASATQSYPVSVPSIVGGNSAYLGFTAGTGNLTATQDILTWTYSPSPVSTASSVSDLTIAAPTLLSGLIGTSYSLPMRAGGGTSPYKWSVAAGNLPQGLSLDPISGVISGTPTATEKASFIVQVVDQSRPVQTASMALSINVLPSPPSIPAAARLLDQATFGPTKSDIAHVQSSGLSGYLTEQFLLPATSLQQFGLPVPAPCDSEVTCWGSVWWKASLTAPDQLRQRVAFALSHIFVTSTGVVGGYAMVPYYNILIKDSFTNWRTIMGDVTLSSAMGQYLNMVNSGKPSPGQGANENFARESLQLFSVGTALLNLDGTKQTDAAGHLIPVYTQDQVQAFARVYTGWTFATPGIATPQYFQGALLDPSLPMVAVESQHDTNAKSLLNGTVLGAGQTAAQDLSDALDNVFQHPNLPPFICRQLIQNLITGNPSPAYVARVANVFVNNGYGVRGDMKAVIAAILLDEEARRGDTDPTFDGGHLREPLLYLANVLRALPFTPTDTTTPWSYWPVLWTISGAGQAPSGSPSVFYYYSPSYTIPGTNLISPEFGMENISTVSSRMVMADQLLYGLSYGIQLNLSSDKTLMELASSPGGLTDELGTRFLHGQMPDPMKQVIMSTISPMTDNMQRLRVAIYLVITSSQYKILH